MMAERTLRRAATAPLAACYNLTPPPEVYDPSQSRTDRPGVHRLHMERMINQVRNRYASSPNLGTAVDHHSSTESEEALTPTSNDDREEIQDQVPQPDALASDWRPLINTLLARHPVQATAEPSPDTNVEGYYSRVKNKKLEDFERGTAQLGHLLNSNDSFCIYRKYGDEAARVLLRKEIELCNLATKLDELNKTDAEGDLNWRLTTFEHDESWDPVQHKLLNDIEAKLNAYYDFLLKYTAVRALPGVPPRYHESVQNWVAGNAPLRRGEDTFLENRDDFITARWTPETKNIIEDLVERLATWSPGSRINSWLGKQEEKNKDQPDYPPVVHLSTHIFDIVSKLAAALLALGLVLTPVLILFLANLGRGKMAAVVGVFNVIYLFGAALVIELSTSEIFIYTVAYSAILVTLLSNFLQVNPAGGSPQ